MIQWLTHKDGHLSFYATGHNDVKKKSSLKGAVGDLEKNTNFSLISSANVPPSLKIAIQSHAHGMHAYQTIRDNITTILNFSLTGEKTL